MNHIHRSARRGFLRTTGAAAIATSAGAFTIGGASAQSFPFRPNQRYPDAAVQILDPSFAK